MIKELEKNMTDRTARGSISFVSWIADTLG